MNSNTIARFDDLEWQQIAPGAREKRAVFADYVLRLVEFTSEFQESDWCMKSHFGYVVEGEFKIQFRDHVVHYRCGDGILLDGEANLGHKACVETKATLFLMEPNLENP